MNFLDIFKHVKSSNLLEGAKQAAFGDWLETEHKMSKDEFEKKSAQVQQDLMAKFEKTDAYKKANEFKKVNKCKKCGTEDLRGDRNYCVKCVQKMRDRANESDAGTGWGKAHKVETIKVGDDTYVIQCRYRDHAINHRIELLKNGKLVKSEEADHWESIVSGFKQYVKDLKSPTKESQLDPKFADDDNVMDVLPTKKWKAGPKMKRDPFMPSSGCDHCGNDPVRFAGMNGDYCSMACLKADEGKANEGIEDWDMQVHSVPMSDEERKTWKNEDDMCPRCNQKFGSYKQWRLKDGTIVHRKCISSDEYNAAFRKNESKKKDFLNDLERSKNEIVGTIDHYETISPERGTKEDFEKEKQAVVKAVKKVSAVINKDKTIDESKTHDRYDQLKKEIDELWTKMQAETDEYKKKELEYQRDMLRQERSDIEDKWRDLGRESRVNEIDMGGFNLGPSIIAALAMPELKKHVGTEEDPIHQKMLAMQEGTSNKYHLIAMFKVGNKYVAANAYGRIGAKVRCNTFAQGFDKEDIENDYHKKIDVKLYKGYKSVSESVKEDLAFRQWEESEAEDQELWDLLAEEFWGKQFTAEQALNVLKLSKMYEPMSGYNISNMTDWLKSHVKNGAIKRQGDMYIMNESVNEGGLHRCKRCWDFYEVTDEDRRVGSATCPRCKKVDDLNAPVTRNTYFRRKKRVFGKTVERDQGRIIQKELMHPGAYCNKCGKDATEEEYSYGGCKCGGDIVAESKQITEEEYVDPEHTGEEWKGNDIYPTHQEPEIQLIGTDWKVGDEIEGLGKIIKITPIIVKFLNDKGQTSTLGRKPLPKAAVDWFGGRGNVKRSAGKVHKVDLDKMFKTGAVEKKMNEAPLDIMKKITAKRQAQLSQWQQKLKDAKTPEEKSEAEARVHYLMTILDQSNRDVNKEMVLAGNSFESLVDNLSTVKLDESEKLKVGMKVRIGDHSGLLSNKTGRIVNSQEVKTNGRAIPTNVAGAYKPVDWTKEVAIKLDNGEIVTMFKNRVFPVQELSHLRAEEILNILMSQRWDDQLQTELATGLEERFPDKKKQIDKMLDAAGDASNLRDQMQDDPNLERRYSQTANTALKMLALMYGNKPRLNASVNEGARNDVAVIAVRKDGTAEVWRDGDVVFFDKNGARTGDQKLGSIQAAKEYLTKAGYVFESKVNEDELTNEPASVSSTASRGLSLSDIDGVESEVPQAAENPESEQNHEPDEDANIEGKKEYLGNDGDDMYFSLLTLGGDEDKPMVESVNEAKWEVDYDYGSGSKSLVNDKYQIFYPISIKALINLEGDDEGLMRELQKGNTYAVQHGELEGDQTIKYFKTREEARSYFEQMKKKLTIVDYTRSNQTYGEGSEPTRGGQAHKVNGGYRYGRCFVSAHIHKATLQLLSKAGQAEGPNPSNAFGWDALIYKAGKFGIMFETFEDHKNVGIQKITPFHNSKYDNTLTSQKINGPLLSENDVFKKLRSYNWKKIISARGSIGERVKLTEAKYQVVDANDQVVYPKDGQDQVSSDPAQFIIDALNALKISNVSYDIVMKYIVPPADTKMENEEEEQEPKQEAQKNQGEEIHQEKPEDQMEQPGMSREAVSMLYRKYHLNEDIDVESLLEKYNLNEALTSDISSIKFKSKVTDDKGRIWYIPVTGDSGPIYFKNPKDPESNIGRPATVNMKDGSKEQVKGLRTSSVSTFKSVFGDKADQHLKGSYEKESVSASESNTSLAEALYNRYITEEERIGIAQLLLEKYRLYEAPEDDKEEEPKLVPEPASADVSTDAGKPDTETSAPEGEKTEDQPALKPEEPATEVDPAAPDKGDLGSAPAATTPVTDEGGDPIEGGTDNIPTTGDPDEIAELTKQQIKQDYPEEPFTTTATVFADSFVHDPQVYGRIRSLRWEGIYTDSDTFLKQAKIVGPFNNFNHDQAKNLVTKFGESAKYKLSRDGDVYVYITVRDTTRQHSLEAIKDLVNADIVQPTKNPGEIEVWWS